MIADPTYPVGAPIWIEPQHSQTWGGRAGEVAAVTRSGCDVLVPWWSDGKWHAERVSVRWKDLARMVLVPAGQPP